MLNDTRLLGDGMDATVISTHPNNSQTSFVEGTTHDSLFENLTFSAGTSGSGGDFSMFNALGGSTKNLVFSGVRFTQADDLQYRSGNATIPIRYCARALNPQDRTSPHP